MTSPTLRPYQAEIYRALVGAAGAGQSPLVALPTGGGKSVIGAAIARGTYNKGNRSGWLVHRRELVDQAVDHMRAAGLEAGVIMAGEEARPHAPVQVCSIQTLLRREVPDDIHVWQYDEAQHSVAETHVKLLERVRPSARFMCGWSATPCRTNGGSLRPAGWDTIIEGPTTNELIKQGYLADYDYYAPSTVDMTGVSKSGGDFSRKGSGQKMRPLVGKVVDHYRRYLMGKRVLVFCSTVKQSLETASAFAAADIRSSHADAKTPKQGRDAIISRFRDGEIKVFSNVQLVDEGFDLPECDGVIIARPTQSLIFHRQACGRALRRKADGRKATIIDMAGNVERLGLPDEPVEWTLEGKAVSSSRKPYKICPTCFAAVAIGSSSCHLCGHDMSSGVRPRVVRQVAGTMKKVERVKRPEVLERGEVEAYYALLLQARSSGYKLKWASARFQQRFGFWPTGAQLRQQEDAARDGCPHVAQDRGVCRFCGRGVLW